MLSFFILTVSAVATEKAQGKLPTLGVHLHHDRQDDKAVYLTPLGEAWGWVLVGFPNFGRSVLGCTEADVCK